VVSMTKPLTNVILASIIHLIRWDLAGNQPRLAPPRHHCHRIHHRTLRAVTTSPSYRSMELSSSRSSMLPLPPFGTPYTPNMGSVDLDPLAGPLEGITPITAAESIWWTSRMSQVQEASGVPATESRGGHQRWTHWLGVRLIS
jgi:hypothetical protein